MYVAEVIVITHVELEAMDGNGVTADFFVEAGDDAEFGGFGGTFTFGRFMYGWSCGCVGCVVVGVMIVVVCVVCCSSTVRCMFVFFDRISVIILIRMCIVITMIRIMIRVLFIIVLIRIY